MDENKSKDGTPRRSSFEEQVKGRINKTNNDTSIIFECPIPNNPNEILTKIRKADHLLLLENKGITDFWLE